MVINMHTKVRRTMHEQSENINKETENIRKYQTKTTELKNKITELKNSVELFNSRLYDRKKSISVSKDMAVEINQSEELKKKKKKRKKE